MNVENSFKLHVTHRQEPRTVLLVYDMLHLRNRNRLVPRALQPQTSRDYLPDTDTDTATVTDTDTRNAKLPTGG